MSWRRIGVLLVLVAGLGAYLYFYELPRAEKEAKKEKLLAVDKDAITGIELLYADREIALKKDDKGWRLTKPVDAPAEDAAVKSLLTSLTDAEVQKTLEEVPADLAPFGLEKPQTTVRLTLKSGEAPPIAVGKNTAIGGRTYVRRGEEPKIYLTGSTLGFALNKQAKDLRDKQILAFQDDDVSRVEIAADGKTTTLVRKDKDAWTVQPGDHPADVTEVRSYLSSLRSTRAVDFPDDAPAELAKYGLDQPRLTVTVFTGKDGAQTQALLVGGETTQGTQKQLYVKRASTPTVFALGDWAFRTLNKDANQFRDKTVLGFDTSRVGRMVLARKDGAAVTLVRGGDGAWQVEGAEPKKSKETAIARFADDARDLRGADVAAEPATDLKPFGLDAPDLRIVLTDKDGQAMGTILAAKHDEKYYVMREGGPTVFEARDYMFTRLDKQRKDFLEAAPAAGAAVSQSATTTVPPPADLEGEGGEEEDGGADGDVE